MLKEGYGGPCGGFVYACRCSRSSLSFLLFFSPLSEGTTMAGLHLELLLGKKHVGTISAGVPEGSEAAQSGWKPKNTSFQLPPYVRMDSMLSKIRTHFISTQTLSFVKVI